MVATLRQKRFGFALASWALLGLGTVGWQAGNTVTVARASELSPNINDYIADKLDDFTATMKIAQHDDRALDKVGRDFGMIYKIKGDLKVRYKEENKLRLDCNIGTLVNNGSMQYARFGAGGGIIKVPAQNLGDAPGKRKTLLDAGLISSGYLAYTQAQYVGGRPVEGVLCAVFRISYRDQSKDTSHRIVWIDPKTKITLKREEYNQEGKLNATFYYKEPKEVAPNVWFPSRIEVVNNEGTKAGATIYSNVKVNQGLDDSIFKL